MVGQLIDNVSEIITGKVNMNAIFQIQVWETVIKILEKNKKEIDALIPKAFAELKTSKTENLAYTITKWILRKIYGVKRP